MFPSEGTRHWTSQVDPVRMARCYDLAHVTDYGASRGGGLLICTGAGLMLADMDVLPSVRWCVDIGASRGHPRAADWAAVCGRLVTHTVAHLWMMLTSPDWMLGVLQQLPPDRLAVCSRPALDVGYQADGIDQLAEWCTQWTSSPLPPVPAESLLSSASSVLLPSS